MFQIQRDNFWQVYRAIFPIHKLHSLLNLPFLLAPALKPHVTTPPLDFETSEDTWISHIPPTESI